MKIADTYGGTYISTYTDCDSRGLEFVGPAEICTSGTIPVPTNFKTMHLNYIQSESVSKCEILITSSAEQDKYIMPWKVCLDKLPEISVTAGSSVQYISFSIDINDAQYALQEIADLMLGANIQISFKGAQLLERSEIIDAYISTKDNDRLHIDLSTELVD